MSLTNTDVLNHSFLEDMYSDGYFPDFLVDKCKAILIGLCEQIEELKPEGEGVYELTHVATEAFNALESEFHENESELETAARECIAGGFDFILKAYGYEVDLEEAIAPREW